MQINNSEFWLLLVILAIVVASLIGFIFFRRSKKFESTNWKDQVLPKNSTQIEVSKGQTLKSDNLDAKGATFPDLEQSLPQDLRNEIETGQKQKEREIKSQMYSRDKPRTQIQSRDRIESSRPFQREREEMLNPSRPFSPEFDKEEMLNSLSRPLSSGFALSINNRVPEQKRTGPLPHNGLFIRRNNAYGTRSIAGIKELIDNGVIIDQAAIRFDDFVVTNNDDIPLPIQNNSIEVSHGIGVISTIPKHHEEATHYLEIALRAGNTAPTNHPKTTPLALNYMFVIDTSGSMDGEKLDNVKTAIREIFLRMRDTDAIGVVEFNTGVKTLIKSTEKTKITLDEFSDKLNQLRASGSTDLNMGILFSLDEIGRVTKGSSLDHVYLFTDGNPTSGETNWIKIRQNVAEKTRNSINLSIFGFGSDANMRELDALAGITGGKSIFVRHTDDIKVNLFEDIGRRDYLAGLNIQLQIEIDPRIDILYFYGHDEITDPATRAEVMRDVETSKRVGEKKFGTKSAPDLITQEKGIRIFAPDLAVGETYWIVFELNVPGSLRNKDFGEAKVQYIDTFERRSVSQSIKLSYQGRIPNDAVTSHGLALWTSEVAFYTLDDLYAGELDTAKARINNHIGVLESTKTVMSKPSIDDDIIALKKFRTLSSNLGRRVSFSDSGMTNYIVFSLSSFGKARDGYFRSNYMV